MEKEPKNIHNPYNISSVLTLCIYVQLGCPTLIHRHSTQLLDCHDNELQYLYSRCGSYWMDEPSYNFHNGLEHIGPPNCVMMKPRLVDMSKLSNCSITRVILVSIRNHMHAIYNTTIGV